MVANDNAPTLRENEATHEERQQPVAAYFDPDDRNLAKAFEEEDAFELEHEHDDIELARYALDVEDVEDPYGRDF